MANTRGFEVVIEASEAVIGKVLRGAWKSAECPEDPGDEGRIPEYLDIPTPLVIGGYEVEDGQVQIPQDELDATLAPDINGAELKLGLNLQLEINNPPVPSAQLFDISADVVARVPIGTLPDSQDVGLLLDGLPRGNVSTTVTSGHPLDAKLDTLLSEFIHLVYENGGTEPPTDPHIPHQESQESVPIEFGGVELARADTHVEIFDDETDPAHRINVSRPQPDKIRISLPIYLRIFNIFALPDFAVEDPMGIETRLNILADFENNSAGGVYRARLGTAAVTVDPIQPAGADVSGSTLEGDNYNANRASIPGLDLALSHALQTRGEELAHDVGDFEIAVPTLAEIETAIGDVFHEELESREFLGIWTPSASVADFETENVAVEVISEALIIALNGSDAADVTAITGFIPAGREFAIALSGETLQAQLDQARAENGFAPGDLPRRLESDGEEVDLRVLRVFPVDGAIRMEGEVTVIDAILGSIDVDATFQVDVGLHWEPDAAVNSSGVQELKHHIIGDPDVDPEGSVLFWVIAVILAVISFGAGSVLIAIIILVVAAIIQTIATNIGSGMVVNGVTGAVEGIEGWPRTLSRIGNALAVFHDNTTPDPDGVIIEADGLVLEGTMEIVSSCESTAVLAANSGSTYSVNAATPVLLKAFNTHAAASYRWLAGDGSVEEAVRDKLHTYTASGIFVGKHALTIEQPGGATSRHFALVNVRNVPPQVDAGPDITVDEGEVVTLVGRFTDVEPSDTHESIWIFGDSQPPEPGVLNETHDPPRGDGTSTVKHAWCDNGEYVVLLRVRDQNGGVGADTLRVTVLNVPPTVEAGPDYYAYECAPITLVGRFEDPGWCDSHTGFWDFGDCSGEQTAVVTETNEPPAARGIVVASHTYRRCGTYHATCRVKDDDGAEGSDFTVIRVIDVLNRDFEGGFRSLEQGEVANGWSPYSLVSHSAGASTAPMAGTGRLTGLFSCEACVVHGGQRSQRISLPAPGRAGIYQSVGANPGWGYQITTWCTTAERSPGVARLGVDPTGGTDPASTTVSWSEVRFEDHWQQMVQSVIATDHAITVFLEAGTEESGNAGRQGPPAHVWFDDVALLPRQPYCPETPIEELPQSRCVGFGDLKNQSQLPAIYDKEGFVFTSIAMQPLRVVDWGAPHGEHKLFYGRGLIVDLPFAADQVSVEISVNTGAPVRVLALDSAGEVVAHGETPSGANGTLQSLEMTAHEIVRLQIASKGGEETLYRICARQAPDRSLRPSPNSSRLITTKPFTRNS